MIINPTNHAEVLAKVKALREEAEQLLDSLPLNQWDYSIQNGRSIYIGPNAHNDASVILYDQQAITAANQMALNGKRVCRRKGCPQCKARKA